MSAATRGVSLLVAGVLLSVLAVLAAHAGSSSLSNDTPWAAAIRAMDEALSKGDVQAALKANEQAHQAAFESRRWDALAAVGDATLKLAQRPGLRRAMNAAARRAYLSALFQARRQGSLDGVLRVTEAFAVLGDREVARQGFVIANVLAAASSEPHARERVRGLRERLAGEAPLVGGLPLAPLRPRTRGTHGAE